MRTFEVYAPYKNTLPRKIPAIIRKIAQPFGIGSAHFFEFLPQTVSFLATDFSFGKRDTCLNVFLALKFGQ